MKRLLLSTVALLVFLFLLYAIPYRRSPVSFQALSLVKGERMLYLPKSLWSCSKNGSCLAQLNGVALQIETTFRPAGSPFGECRARYGAHSLECTVRQHYYYRFGETMRPYLVLTDDAEAISLTVWQATRFRVETVLATLALGEESAWTIVTGAIALAAGAFTFWSLARPLQAPAWSSYKKVLAVSSALIISVALAAIVWTATLAFLFTGGVILD